MQNESRESNKKSRLFRFLKHFNVIVMEVLYVLLYEVFANTKQTGFLMLLSFNKCSISALNAPIYQ